MIKEAYVSLETAKRLKEKGFDESCRARYDYNGILHYEKYPIEASGAEMHNSILCPTLQMACRWLREKHGIHIEALCPVVDVDADTNGVKYNVVISNLKNYCLAYNTPIEDNEYDSYEKAIEAACLYVLKNII